MPVSASIVAQVHSRPASLVSFGAFFYGECRPDASKCAPCCPHTMICETKKISDKQQKNVHARKKGNPWRHQIATAVVEEYVDAGYVPAGAGLSVHAKTYEANAAGPSQS